MFKEKSHRNMVLKLSKRTLMMEKNPWSKMMSLKRSQRHNKRKSPKSKRRRKMPITAQRRNHNRQIMDKKTKIFRMIFKLVQMTLMLILNTRLETIQRQTKRISMTNQKTKTCKLRSSMSRLKSLRDHLHAGQPRSRQAESQRDCHLRGSLQGDHLHRSHKRPRGPEDRRHRQERHLESNQQ